MELPYEFTLEGQMASVAKHDENVAARIGQFLNRWHWRGHRDVVRAELEDLIAFAQRRSQRRGED